MHWLPRCEVWVQQTPFIPKSLHAMRERQLVRDALTMTAKLLPFQPKSHGPISRVERMDVLGVGAKVMWITI